MKALLSNLTFAALLFTSFSAHAVLFRLPLSSDTAVHYYYDHNTSSGIQDWKCGTETYNGHRGTDFSGGPRGRAIFAAAVGTLEDKIDAFGDGVPGSMDGGGFGNRVRLGHAGGSVTWYGHMTLGSVTTKAVGSAIACGEQIGGVGTSGSSSGLHLHFEPRVNNVGFDPFSGACSGPTSWWVNQGSGSPSTTCEGPKFSSGDTVEVFNTGGTGLKAWTSTCSGTYVNKPDGSTGIIQSGPVECDGYMRWRIRYAGDSVDRWSAEDWLRKIATQTRIILLSGNLGFGVVEAGSSAQRTLTIANTGNSTLTVSSISYPSGFSGSWSGTIAAGNSQNVTVTFSPNGGIGPYGGTVTVNSDKTSGANTIVASGTGGLTPTKIISLSGDLTFGNVAVGSSSQRTLTIANNGNSTLTVSSISYPSGFSGSWSGTIAVGNSQNVTVTFSPSAATSYGGNLTVNSDKTSGTSTRAVSGTGTASPTRIISLSGSLAFGDVTVGSSAQRTLTIANNGNSTMTVNSISYPSGFSGAWSGTITAGGSQNVTVTFSPSAATSYGGTVTVNANQTSGVNTIAASGTGTAAPTRIISLSGNLAFGNVTVGSSAQSTLTIANNGNSTMTVSSISYPSGFSGNWSSGTIAAGGSQNVTVTFSPSAATSYGGTVTVNGNQTSGGNTIGASGTGTITPTCIISLSGDLAFGSVVVGSSAQRTLTIANTGNSTMTVSSISYPSGFSGNWSSGTIAAGGSQNVTVTFSPGAATSYGGTVTVNANQTSGGNTMA
ncbi:MAG: choice-of-anchor D domain-containing protein [Verrucomicrobia bacterium]|nr:choice-of-anchor D domain-containing protein [Verrucomicrobiota bacterium]